MRKHLPVKGCHPPVKGCHAYVAGLKYASICSELTLQQTIDVVNLRSKRKWKKSIEKFKDGTPNPCICKDYPETHKHYLFEIDNKGVRDG